MNGRGVIIDSRKEDYTDDFVNQCYEKIQQELEQKIPIRKGCHAVQNGGCFCTGKCQEIIGYRDKLPNEI